MGCGCGGGRVYTRQATTGRVVAPTQQQIRPASQHAPMSAPAPYASAQRLQAMPRYTAAPPQRTMLRRQV